MSRPVLARLSLWQKYERILLETVQEALELLIDIGEDRGELSINEELYRAMLEADRRRYERGEPVLDQGPIYDAQMGPADPAWAAANRTRPDIRWDLMNHQAETTAEQVLPFVVECKRLRSPTDRGWLFNKAYVVHGVKRFTSLSHRYGANSASGVMVGYWQNMEHQAVLDEVNAALEGEGFGVISLTPVSARIRQSSQRLDRPFQVSPFDLRHYWVDVRLASSAESASSKAKVKGATADEAAKLMDVAVTDGLGREGDGGSIDQEETDDHEG